tara:strand:+ start:87 stop:317 length:231 start_codon:yes stop_codon:yes gene_type:complete
MSIFYISGIVSVIYLVIKFLEMRFIVKENKPFKKLFRDALIVYFSSIGGYYLIQQIEPISENLNEKVVAFTNPPDF